MKNECKIYQMNGLDFKTSISNTSEKYNSCSVVVGAFRLI